MPNKLFRVFGSLALVFSVAAVAQDAPAGTTYGSTTSHSRLGRALEKIDLGVSGIGTLTKSVSGTSTQGANAPQSFTEKASTAAGLLVTLHGQKSPYVGMEFNYSLSKADFSFNCCNYDPRTAVALQTPFQAQSGIHEYTLGYTVRPQHTLLGAKPFAAAGLGTVEFVPTRNGGNNLPTQARMAYYWAAGGEAPVTSSFGFRIGVRQLLYTAPDFGQNYFTIHKRTFTFEPQIGIYLHF